MFVSQAELLGELPVTQQLTPEIAFEQPAFPGDVGAFDDNRGWPVATPFKYYPQGQVNEDGTGVYNTLIPTDCPENCFCTPPPCYFGTVFFEGIVLDRRSNLESNDVIFDALTNAPLFNTSQFNLATEAGFRLGFLWSSPSGVDWSVDYFGIHSYENQQTITSANSVYDVFFGSSQQAAPLASLTARYETDLDSIEVLTRFRLSRRVAPLIGIRMVAIDESFDSLTSVTDNTGWFSAADNELYGFEFGFQALLYEVGKWRWETTIKAGPFYNDHDIETRIIPVGSTAQLQHKLDRNHVAFLGEVRLNTIYQLGPRWNFRVGYHALWLEGVALAPNQTDNFSIMTGIQSADLNGVLYQGGNIGFDFSW